MAKQTFSLEDLQTIAEGSKYVKYINPPSTFTSKYRFVGRHPRARRKIDLFISERLSEHALKFINIWYPDTVKKDSIFEVSFIKVDGEVRVLNIEIVSE
jgi:hypothetical protein